MDKSLAIGFMDSGIGGLSVLRKAIKYLPDENFIYFGDSKNCPYGNRTADDIYTLSVKMLDYFKQKGVKCVCVACNTISALGDRLSAGYDFPVIRIADCCADKIKEMRLSSVGLLGTAFTVNSGVYQRLISRALPDCEVVGTASEHLARLVETTGYDSDACRAEIKACINKILEKKPVKDIILGCTHYPLAMSIFKEEYPDINFIDPADAQCERLMQILKEGGANNRGGCFELYTSGDINDFFAVTDALGIRRPDKCASISL